MRFYPLLNLRRREEARGAELADLGGGRSRLGGRGVEVRDGFLEPGQDFGRAEARVSAAR